MSHTTYKSRRSAGRMVLTIFLVALLCIVALLFVGCAVKVTPVAAPSTASAPSEEVEEAEDDGIYTFGDTVDFDGITIHVAEPSKYKPTNSAMGMIDGNKSIVFEFVLTNNSTEKYEPLFRNSASSGGEEASSIFDYENNVEFPPTTTVLPGKSIKWQEAFSVVDPSDITLEMAFGYDFNTTIFTSK